MTKFGLYTEKSPIPFDTHLGGLDDETRKKLLDLRTFIIGLGNNVIEEVRPHRIVYAKTLTFRTFLDIQPKTDSLVISVRKSRHESTVEHTIRSGDDLEPIKHQITLAYEKIR
jgi:hypothetical protein